MTVRKREAAPGEEGPHLAHLYVAQSNEDWCPEPCQGPTWELAAPKPDLGSPYVLLEAAIWRQERRVALYRFDAAWERRARRTYSEVCHGIAWSCLEYKTFREERLVLNVGPWPASADHDAEQLSGFLLEAFEQIFAKLREVAPKAAHTGFTYSGHGARADGSLFEGALHKQHASALLQAAGRMSFLNFGGNCAEGRWNMIAALHPHANWILASDLDVGGVENTEEENTAESTLARERLLDVTILKNHAESRETLDVTMEGIVTSRSKIWETVWKAPIQRQNLRQSIAAFRGNSFQPFADALRAAYLVLPEDRRDEFQDAVEAAECDVLAAATFLDGASGGEAKLVPRFLAMRPLYASTKDLVKWSVDTNGLGFNYMGWHSPPCDLETALGADAPAPAGGWHHARMKKRSL